MSRERPILFSSPMVMAILDGHKTQTRRIIKDHKGYHPVRRNSEFTLGEDGLWRHYSDGTFTSSDWRCPYGKVGDRLWVRETWRTDDSLDDKAPSDFSGWPVKYAADGEVLRHGACFGNANGRTRASIHMPRWAGRITLEITAIRVERLQDISEADAIAEGGQWSDNGPRDWVKPWSTFDEVNPVNGWKEGWSHTGETNPDKCLGSARMSFGNLWESINGQGYPWVWVIEFKRVLEANK